MKFALRRLLGGFTYSLLLLSGGRWKKGWLYKLLIGSACYFWSIIWIVIEMTSYFVPTFANWSRGNFTLFTTIVVCGLTFGVVRFFAKCQRMFSVRHRIDGKDISIEIEIGDIFESQGAFIISTNTTFETDLSQGLISKESLQGQFTLNYYDNVEHLDHDLEKELAGEDFCEIEDDRKGKRKRYDIGTTVRIAPKDQVIYLVAVANLNEFGKAGETPKEDIIKCLGRLWYEISQRGELEPLVIPILGTGLARCPISREEMIREIIKSFVAACSERKFCEKLTIVISSEDYRNHEMDIQELGNYLRHHCKYADIRNPTDIGMGQALS